MKDLQCHAGMSGCIRAALHPVCLFFERRKFVFRNLYFRIAFRSKSAEPAGTLPFER